MKEGVKTELNLDQEEIDLMNEIKLERADIVRLVRKLSASDKTDKGLLGVSKAHLRVALSNMALSVVKLELAKDIVEVSEEEIKWL